METTTIVEEVSRSWWAFALRGVFAVLFGIGALVWPGPTVWVLVVLFGAYAIADGILTIGAAFASARFNWSLLLAGIAGIAAGVIAFAWPGITALALLYVIGAWAVVTGAMEIATAVRLRKEIEDEWILGFGGLLSVLFGLVIAISPGAGALSVVWLISVYAIAAGITLIALGFRLRKWHTVTETTRPGAHAARAA